MTDVIAAMYPLNIPPASKVGAQTFEKYIQETSLFKDEKNKALAIKQTRSDMEEFRRLKYKTEARNPPLDQSGKYFCVSGGNIKKWQSHVLHI